MTDQLAKPESSIESDENCYPVLTLRDVVVYPYMVIPLFVGREKSIKALDDAMAGDKKVLLIAQKNADVESPSVDELYEIGTVSNILQLLKLPDGTIKVLVEGSHRAKVSRYDDSGEYFKAYANIVATDVETIEDEKLELEGISRSLLNVFDQYVKLNKKIPSEILTSLSGIDAPSRMADTIAAHISLKLDEKQSILEMLDARSRLEHLMTLIEGEIEILQVEKRIRGRVKQQMEKSQREYYLNEQMKAIQKELGDLDNVPNEFEDLAEKIKTSGMPKEAKKKAKAELNKLKMMSPMAAEATVIRNYIDCMVNVPWSKKSKIKKDLQSAEDILNEDHYGLEKVKQRILEYLAVQARVKKMQGPILCLVGPPGVGKTSLGRSIARATNRKFTKMALGGVRDEAEIRGHRRTYIGSMPGRIIQNLTKVKTRNPLFLFDEIDKMANDFRGDPASALLEVLDPEQNHAFADHYLEVDYDLSEVMFIATSNSMNIPGPLLDRMEIIRLSGYTEDEKVNIAEKYLLPKQIKRCGLKEDELTVDTSVIVDIVRYYTREAGVRGLEKEVAKICRRVVKDQVLNKSKKAVRVTSEELEKYLDVKRFRYGQAVENNRIGQVTGLAWTEVGGELLTIETAVVSGKGQVIRTGHLGDVMKESIEAARTVVRTRAEQYGLATDYFEKHDLHVHVPEGATPKDGPSAGIGMCTALISAILNISVNADVAMTGEITLRGEVLPIGGLKEKLLAAHRGGIKTAIIPMENKKDLAEIPKKIINDLQIIPVQWIDEVLDVALTEKAESILEKQDNPLSSKAKNKNKDGNYKPVSRH